MKTKLIDWKKEPIKSHRVGCLCCGGNEQVLPLETVLYNGYGGWSINKNGNQFFQEESDVDWDKSKTLQLIEDMIGNDEDNCYEAVLFTPLRGGTWQRHSKNNWVLIEENEGFA